MVWVVIVIIFFCYYCGVFYFVKNIYLMFGKIFVNNREEVFFLSRVEIFLVKKLDVGCFCKISNIVVIVVGK